MIKPPSNFPGSTGDEPSAIAKSELEQTILKAGALQSAILKSANFSIIATDETGIIQLFNTGAERMLGYKAADIVNKLTPSDLHDPLEVVERAHKLSVEFAVSIAPGFEAMVYKASRGIEDIYELTYLRKNGSRLPAVLSVTALRDDFTRIIGYLLIGTDNSARKRVALELHEAMVVAERANLAKSDFLSSMSHELRTPLSAILGFAQLIESGTPPPSISQKRSVDQILLAGWYLLDLINEILDLAQIESGKLPLSMESVLLAEILTECQTMVEAQAELRGISMLFSSLEAPYLVKADRTRIKQALINLLVNAIKYNRPNGSVVVDCTLITPERIRISITDTGAGLHASKVQHLFEPFNRLGQEQGEEEGTGIGLVVCKRLIELMGGAIGVKSVEGVGSTFWIELNQTQAQWSPDDMTGAAIPADVQLESVTPLYTLLYVEDNPANLMLVEDIVARRPDIRLLSAIDGNQGVELARASLPDVILMDINLPGISGIRAMRILAEDVRTAWIPVVALSANAMPRDIENGLRAGFFRYLTKPIRVGKFLETLDAALAHSQSMTGRIIYSGDA